MLKINKYVSSLFLSVFVLFGTTVGSTAVMAESEKFVLISHAPDSDSWWNTIKMQSELLVSKWESMLIIVTNYRRSC